MIYLPIVILYQLRAIETHKILYKINFLNLSVGFSKLCCLNI